MPLIRFTLSPPVVNASVTEALLAGGTAAIVEVMGKPEKFVMAACQGADIAFGSSRGPAAFVELHSIGGLDDETNVALSERLCALVADAAGVPADRCFLNFVDVPRPNWGWNGGTFGQKR